MSTNATKVKDHFATFQYGYNGRSKGIPFNVHASEEWKQGWHVRDDEIAYEADAPRRELEERIERNKQMYAERVKAARLEEQQAITATTKEWETQSNAYIAKIQAERVAREQKKNANKVARAEANRALKHSRSGPGGKKGK